MQFPNIEDDDGDFGLGSTSRSRLSSLFQTERPSGDVNQALTFTAPKQPKKNDGTQPSQGTLKLIHVAAVHAYKLVDGNYANQGKLGCAILGLHETSSYRLLLYKGKQVQVSTCNILPNFQFHVQPNNYATFYDDKKENWSLLFESESSLFDFAKQIALAKANAQDKSQLSLVIQDLVQGEGSTLDIGDSAEVKYTGWLLSNYTLGQVFDSNMNSESVFRMRLGKKVIKGWSEGLVGAQKGTKRVLIIPPSLAYGAEGMGSAVPPNASLIFEIHVLKIKKSRDSSHSPSPMKTVENVPEKKPEVLPRHSITSEDNIRLRGASISEQLAQSPKKDKAQLISRMAKMGTATLPFQGAIPAQVSSDSENEEETQPEKPAPVTSQTESRTSSPKRPSRPSSRKNSEPMIASQAMQLQSVQESSPYHSSQQPSPVQYFSVPNQTFATPVSAFPAFQPQIPNQYQLAQAQYPMHTMAGMVPPVSTSIADTHLPMLITETRSQNTEVRLSLSKITDKVDTVIQKVDDLRLNQGRSSGLSHSTFMDSAILLQSIEKIIQENNQLKEDNEAKNSKIQSLNEKICDLLQRNQRFFEESNNILEHRSDSFHALSADSQAKLLNLEKEKAILSNELSNALAKLSAAESQLSNQRNQESELKGKLQQNERRIEDLNSELQNLREKSGLESESSSQLNSLKSEIKTLQEENSRLSSQINNFEEKYNNQNKILLEKTKELQKLQELLDKNNSESNEASNTEYEEKIKIIEKDLENVKTRKEELEEKCKDLQTKLTESQKLKSMLESKLGSVLEELKNSLVWKEKYEIFYQKTRQLKVNYENQVQSLMAELKQAQTSAGATNSSDVSGAIKKVMNILYKMLQGKFEPNTSYTGAHVLETTLQAIRSLTFQMLQGKELRADSVAKDANSEKSLETVGKTDSKSDISNINDDKALGDNINEPSQDIKENGISESESISNINSPSSETPLSKPLTDETPTPPEHISSNSQQAESQPVDVTIPNESVDQSLESNLDTNKSDGVSTDGDVNSVNCTPSDSSPAVEEDREQTKSSSPVPDKSKSVEENRASPEHNQHLSSTNTETGNSKVFDGISDLHA